MLTQEEHRLAAAQNLRDTHRVDGRVMNVENGVHGVGERVQGIGEMVQGVEETVQGVDDRVKGVDDKMDVVIEGVHLISPHYHVHTILTECQDAEHIIGELRQVAVDVGDQKRLSSHSCSIDLRASTYVSGNQLRNELLDWLSPPDPFINYNTASDARHDGTGAWVTESVEFKNWKELSSILWILGKCTLSSTLCLRSYQRALSSQPAQVKCYHVSHLSFSLSRITYLLLRSAIIQDIKAISESGLAHMAFFFFDFKDTRKQDARGLLSSVIVQLSNRSQSFYHILFDFYSAHQKGSQQPSIGALTKCLEDMIKTPGDVPIYLILDAVDECPNTKGIVSSRRQVLELVEKLVTLNLPRFHLFITSRPEVDIRTCLEPLAPPSGCISLHDRSGQKSDIVEFVRGVVYSDENMRRWQDRDKELVIKTLSDKADGM